MKKIAILIILLFIPFKVNALYCQNSDISYLKKLASNINSSYTYTENGNSIDFQITLINLQPDLYIVDVTNKQTLYYTNNEITLGGYKSGQSITYNVYTTKQYCEEILVGTIRINLPSYNSYYKDPVCEGIEFELCNKWSSHNLGYTAFVNKVKEYKESQNKKDNIPNQDNDSDYSLFDRIIELLTKYYYIPLALVIIGSGLGIYIINKKSDTYR